MRFRYWEDVRVICSSLIQFLRIPECLERWRFLGKEFFGPSPFSGVIGEIHYDNARLNLIALSTSSNLFLLTRPRRFSKCSFEMVSIWLVFIVEDCQAHPRVG